MKLDLEQDLQGLWLDISLKMLVHKEKGVKITGEDCKEGLIAICIC